MESVNTYCEHMELVADALGWVKCVVCCDAWHVVEKCLILLSKALMYICDGAGVDV